MENSVRPNLIRNATGLLAAGLALYFALAGREDPSILFASAFFFLICITDTLYSKIPNLFTLSLVVVGVLYNLYGAGLSGLLHSLFGLAVGLLLLILPFWFGGIGAGDVKALGALGALVGPVEVFQIFLYVAMVGGIMSILHYVASRNLFEKFAVWRAALFAYVATKDKGCFKPISTGEKLRFPYAAAIAFGYFAFIHWGKII